MVKAIAASITIVCLIGASSLGGILQRQTMDIGLGDSIILDAGPHARATTGQTGLIVNVQGAGNDYGTVALQGQGVALGQTGRASGLCGGLSLIQTIDGGTLPIGTQSQRIGDCCAFSSENQALGFAAGQTLAKTSPGPGRVSGTQGIGAAQAQYARNGFMQMGEGALVVGTQGASITGGVGMVTTTMYADVSQGQLVTNW
jgi:hypothetical protein